MEIFNETFGMEASTLKAFIEWLLTFIVCLFCVVVMKGSYARMMSGDMEFSDVLIDVVIAFAVATGVFTVIN